MDWGQVSEIRFVIVQQKSGFISIYFLWYKNFVFIWGWFRLLEGEKGVINNLGNTVAYTVFNFWRWKLWSSILHNAIVFISNSAFTFPDLFLHMVSFKVGVEGKTRIFTKSINLEVLNSYNFL